MTEATDGLMPCECCHFDAAEMQYHCGVYYVECENCEAQGPLMWAEDYARDAWNTRALPPPPPSVVQELVEALTEVIEHFDRNASKGNAPGHGHQIAGVWDTDVSNGTRGGNACEWCAEWASYRALLTRVKG